MNTTPDESPREDGHDADKIESSSPPGSPSAMLVMTVFCGCGPAAGLLAGWLVHSIEIPLRLPPDLAAMIPPFSAEVEQQMDALAQRSLLLNVLLDAAMVGAVLSVFAGVTAAGLLNRGQRFVVTLLLSVVLGAVFGAVGGWLNFTVRDVLAQRYSLDPVRMTMVIHAVTWSVIGIAAAIAGSFGSGGQRSIASCCTATVGAGLASAILFPLLAAGLFPIDNVEQPVPEGVRSRILWTTLTATLMGITSGRLFAKPLRKEAA